MTEKSWPLPGDELSEQDKITMAALSGCAITVNNDGLRTTHPCGIYHDGQQWVVLEAVNL